MDWQRLGKSTVIFRGILDSILLRENGMAGVEGGASYFRNAAIPGICHLERSERSADSGLENRCSREDSACDHATWQILRRCGWLRMTVGERGGPISSFCGRIA